MSRYLDNCGLIQQILLFICNFAHITVMQNQQLIAVQGSAG